MLRTLRIAVPTLALAMLAPTLAQAHTGLGDVDGFRHGFGHPLGGIDHVLAMVAVGLLASEIAAARGRRALWLVPAAFVGMMVAGGALGVAGLPLPFVEAGIGLSVVVFGLVVALRLGLPIAAAMAVVGLFAVFHGHAHGAEMPETASGLAYGAGFVLATALLHAVGVGLGLAVGRLSGRAGAGPLALRLAGAATAVAGVAILAGAL